MASLVLVAGAVAGCGSEEKPETAEEPEVATVEEFCGVFEDFFAEAQALGADPEQAEMVALVKGVADDLEEVGAPEDMPEDAHAGLDLTVDALQGLPDDATQEDVNSLEADFSEEEQEQSRAFDEWLGESCEPASGESSGSETDPATEDESESPSN